jgi:chromosome segregation ATPase
MEKEIAVIKAGHAQVVEALSAECSRLGQQCREAESAVKKAMEAVDEAEAKRVEAQDAQGAADDRSRSLEREIAGLRQLLEAARVSGDVRDAQVTRWIEMKCAFPC